MPYSDLDTHQKALQINLDPLFYGTFAEIGAGQEIARWFFRVGGAAGTVAKSMSAYDMTVSDAIYGKSKRYVSKERVLAMLDHEYALLTERLAERRDKTCFFAFANSVAARNFKGTNECHGWLGFRFQARAGGPANDIMLHVNMLDRENLQQQEALGVVGVNLMWGAFYQRDNLPEFVQNLLDDLGIERMEIDVLEFSGPDLVQHDNRLASLELLRLGLAKAIIFEDGGKVTQPSEALHNSPVLIERGTYRALKALDIKSIELASKLFEAEPLVKESQKTPLAILEVSILDAIDGNSADPASKLQIVDQLSALGHKVMLSSFKEYYKLVSYLRRYTKSPVGFVMGVGTLARIMNENFYENLDGRLLEALGKLISSNVHLYVYPMSIPVFDSILVADGLVAEQWRDNTQGLVGLSLLHLPQPNGKLLSYCCDRGFIKEV